MNASLSPPSLSLSLSLHFYSFKQNYIQIPSYEYSTKCLHARTKLHTHTHTRNQKRKDRKEYQDDKEIEMYDEDERVNRECIRSNGCACRRCLTGKEGLVVVGMEGETNQTIGPSLVRVPSPTIIGIRCLCV